MKVGMVGCGRFGVYAMEQMLKNRQVHLVAVADANPEAASAAATRFGLAAPHDVEALLASPDVDAVYLATPPYLHYEQTMQALRHGKHVLCEKPLAVTMAQADEMVDAALRDGRLCVVDLLQRYNPLSEKVHRLVQSRLLGEPLHAFFENYASDENLPLSHWFWDRERSGGIFVEHGVHFFDLMAWWLGPGRVVAAQRVTRPGSDIEEQVSCTAMYGSVPAFFYHGFTQPVRMDRQELRILFERGDITLHEWVPTRLELRGLVDDATDTALQELFDGCDVEVVNRYRDAETHVQGRHKSFRTTHRIRLSYGLHVEKMNRYSECIQGFVADQLRSLGDPAHVRRVTEENGRQSLQMAADATRLAGPAEAGLAVR